MVEAQGIEVINKLAGNSGTNHDELMGQVQVRM